MADPGRRACAGTKDSILALISGIAKRAGSSALVLEVLGGVCGHFSAEKLAQGTKTVTQGDVMACFQAALLGSADVSSLLQQCSCCCYWFMHEC